MTQIEKIAELVSKICNDFMLISADGKVSIGDWPQILNIIRELSDIMGVDKLAVLSELDNLNHDKIDAIVTVFDDDLLLDEDKKAVVIDVIRTVLDLVYNIDTILDHVKTLNT